MFKKIIYIFILSIIFLSAGGVAQEKKPVFNVIKVEGVITSPTAKYIADSIEEARRADAEGIIILLDTPGGMDKTMSQKVENDAAAYARSIAKTRGRSEEWVEKAVRKSESITAEEALKLNVIDFVVPDVDKLLTAIDKKEVNLLTSKKKILTKNAVINSKEMGTRQGIL